MGGVTSGGRNIPGANPPIRKLDRSVVMDISSWLDNVEREPKDEVQFG